ncbi:MAG: UDP-N-acetylglucosamine 1-carboxyvinyltransferase [Saccharofermentanales bacterium]
MASYIVRGGKSLKGEVTVSGSKNAALGIIAAAMLLDGPCTIENIPDIADVSIIIEICKSLGAEITHDAEGKITVDPRHLNTFEATHEKARSIRASYYFMGALLGRFKKAVLYMPGGCDFGTRPIDQHLKGFNALGARHTIEFGKIILTADKLVGEHVYFDKVSVGSTINLIIAATKAEGVTVIENAAREPHIVDLANFLNTMGANIKGAGTDVIRITGVEFLPGNSTYAVIPDQIEAGTYMIAAAATGGQVKVSNIIPKHMEPLTAKMEEMGVQFETGDDWISVSMKKGRKLLGTNFMTMPYPGFPTDLQPQTTVLLCLAAGTSRMNENVWDNRFQYIDDLKMMGAEIVITGKVATVEGPVNLTGAKVTARDLRAGAAMVIAGLAAEGSTEVSDIRAIERGYENFVNKLRALGADISKIEN